MHNVADKFEIMGDIYELWFLHLLLPAASWFVNDKFMFLRKAEEGRSGQADSSKDGRVKTFLCWKPQDNYQKYMEYKIYFIVFIPILF
jgi:hypothetical protein